MPAAPTEGPSAPPIVAVVGATASGKTSLSLDLAERLDGEIVNTDAMQVYRGMDVGTAKLPEERRGIPHHLLDTLDVRDPATVAQFQAWAREAIAGPRSRGAGGGAGRWLRALHPRDHRPLRVPRHRRGGAGDPGGRARRARPAPRSTERLADLDPQAAAKIIPENGRRTVRALEVIALTGRPYTASLPTLEYADPRTVQIGVDIDRPTLDARIEQRVDHMFEAGFVDEVDRLLKDGLAEGRTASRAIGYAQVASYLRGELSLAEARERTIERHPPVRAPPGLLVPQGPADRVGALRRPGPGGEGARGRPALTRTVDPWAPPTGPRSPRPTSWSGCSASPSPGSATRPVPALVQLDRPGWPPRRSA